MTEALQDQIQKAINENMPGMLGRELQELLARGRKDTEMVKEQATRLAEFERQQSAWAEALGAQSKVAGREKAVEASERAVEVEKKLNELRAAHAKERVDEMRGLVTAVFGNNRFKYGEVGSMPVGYGGGGQCAGGVLQQSFNKTVEGEG